MMFKDGIQILGTIKDKVVFIPQNTQKRRDYIDEVAKLLLFCEINNIKLNGPKEILYNLNKSSIEELKSLIAPIVGATLFDLNKEYGLEECLKTLAQYMRDYGNFDIPKSIYFDIAGYKKPNMKTSEFELVPVEYFYGELKKILQSPKNPGSYDFHILGMLQSALPWNFGTIINKNVLEYILRANSLNRFKPLNAAQLRIFAKCVEKFRTQDKTFIMKELSQMPESDVLDEFATHRSEWLAIEKRIIPTQKRYKNYKAQRYFHKLRDRDFSDSNNSLVEKMLASDKSSAEKYDALCTLKSPQFAIRNLTRIAKTPADAGDVLGFAIAESNPRLKQLIEAYNGLGLVGSTKTSKIKDKFWTRETKEFAQERNKAIRDILKPLIEAKIEAKIVEYANLIKDKDSQYAKDYNAVKDSNRIKFNDLKTLALPLNTDKFYDFETIPVAGRGSRIPIPENLGDTFCVFVAWKSKDGKEKHQDIDLSCNVVKDGKLVNMVNYCSLSKPGLKHSGDFTSTIDFNPDEGLIVAEMIKVDRKVIQGDLHFMINTFNGVSLSEYDVYAGVAPKSCLTCAGSKEPKYFKLTDAVISFKISGDIDGYYKFFTLAGNELLLEGTSVSGACFASSPVATRGSIQSQEYCSGLGGFSVADFVRAFMGEANEDYLLVNPESLKLQIDYALNS